MSFYDPYKILSDTRKSLADALKRELEWHRHIITRMRDDPALLEKAKGELEKQRARHASSPSKITESANSMIFENSSSFFPAHNIAPSGNFCNRKP